MEKGNDTARYIGADKMMCGTIGGQEVTEADWFDAVEMRRRLSIAPVFGGPKPANYDDATNAIARAFLEMLENPTLSINENTDLYTLLCETCIGFDDWQGGATVFQVGYANAIARTLHRKADRALYRKVSGDVIVCRCNDAR